ncbi:hypothetical protein RFI_12019 [Reticulomyxa filosa]|uniref:Uncharacterized protein n=1 Tax=Reticulomyxa filosa TaxID=46433 RepID=X6NIE3_RETFI|nr:hypothetical protein RFI_12019 [Reticulomyxa filosa]|eukprot:ETO25122.1 hypothetical protein RFI_12019 [Reticulomyxa filosa]
MINFFRHHIVSLAALTGLCLFVHVVVGHDNFFSTDDTTTLDRPSYASSPCVSDYVVEMEDLRDPEYRKRRISIEQSAQSFMSKLRRLRSNKMEYSENKNVSISPFGQLPDNTDDTEIDDNFRRRMATAPIYMIPVVKQKKSMIERVHEFFLCWRSLFGLLDTK